jgi:RNA polymerase sigma-70 factor (ECF subfamily)
VTGRETEALASVPSDADLLAAHAAGDPEAFGEVVRRHRDRLWAVALRTLGDREEAADALQDGLVSAFRAGRTGSAAFRGEAAVTTWLHRIVVNACLDRVRRSAARPADPLPDHDVPARGDQVAARETALDVTAALGLLPVEQRAALVLVDMYGWSVQDAAEALECAPGTVKSRCARGRARLLPLLSPEPPSPGNPADPGGVPPVSASPAATTTPDGGDPT